MPKKKRAIGELSVVLNLKRIGRVLSLSRENLRYSLRELAQETQISATQLLRMESGEFEFSIVKFHAVCVALGIQISDLLEYASVRISKLKDWQQEDILLEEAIHSKNPKEAQRIDDFASNIYEITLRILTSPNPVSCANLISPPPGLKRLESIVSFAAMVNGFSNSERIATLNAIIKTPTGKMRSLGIIKIEDLKMHLAADTDWKLEIKNEESIEKILQSQD